MNNVDNIAYDNGSYYIIDNAGDLLFTDDIITANFTNLGNVNIVNGAYKNLALDNGVFYHWQSSGSQIILYNSPNPVNSGWSYLGNVNGLSETVSEGGKTYQLRDIAVHEGVFYFYYYNTNACPSPSCNVDRTLVFSSSTPTNPTPSWQNHGSTYFGYGVRNIAIGSQDLKALAPPVQDLVIECPDETIDLAIAHTGTTPQGHSLRWFTNDTHSGLPLEANQVANTVEGEYYAFYFNISQNCYSPAAKVIVTKENCQNFCTTGDCNENAFLFTSDPNTLEYDNLISGFHSSIAKQRDGNYLIWGQGAKPNTFGEHLYEPTLIIPENGFNYTGDILKATLGTAGSTNDGHDQYAVITTDGLYIWGGGNNTIASRLNQLVHGSVKNTITFDKMTDVNISNADPATGLPIGVAPTEVKMLFGSYATLGIVTCTGEAYVISHKGNKNGDGSTDGASEYNKWHRVSVGPDQPLNRIVAMRGVPGAMVALTSDGELYTWGSETYLGDGSAKSNRLYATKMTLPAGVTPKMIGMTKASNTALIHRNNSYYLLSTTGEVYSLGDNSKKQLGTFDNIERTQWVNVKSTDASTNMTNIVWISPNEHDNAGHATVTALTADGKLWGWGMNHGNMLGEGNDAAVDPRYMFGGLDHDEKVLAIETGGHINTIFKDCDFKLGYIGHSSNGSYANTSTNTGSTSDVFKFDGAKLTNLCAIYTPPYPELIDLTSCPGSTFDLMDALQNTVPTGYNLEWWTTIDRTPGTEVANPEEAGPGTYYAFFISDESDCQLIEGEEVVASYYEPIDEEYDSCLCFNDPVITGAGSDTQVGISLIKGRENLQSSDNWPQSRKSGFIALESNKQGMVVTRIAKADLGNIVSPQEGMMVYDTTDKCLKIYSDDEWKCFATPACP